MSSIGSLISLIYPVRARLLDLGCNSGWIGRFYARRRFDVVSKDRAPDKINLAHQNKHQSNTDRALRFITSEYETLPFKREFRCAVFCDCLHHADDESAAIRSAYGAIRPRGVLLTHQPSVGHSPAPVSLEAMRLYGVNKRDMTQT
ncbi:class I SAM-dependent methyltransferase [Sphingobium sp. B12D2B]|uniref:class I SAM-dependent methyltransferase n=1 Tax=unclassified Sphingobium TaxID=2611147 RepID=UPI0039B68745